MALFNAQTSADITPAPDAMQLLDVFASLQTKLDVVKEASWNTTTPALNPQNDHPTADQTSIPTSTTFEQEAQQLQTDASLTQAKADEWSAPDEYLVDVSNDLAVQVQAYGSEEASDDEANWEEETAYEDDWQAADESDAFDAEGDEAWSEEGWSEDTYNEDASYDESDDESSNEIYAEENSVDPGSYDQAPADSYEAITVQGSDRIDLSWLGAKFADNGTKLDVYNTVQIHGQVQSQVDDAYAESISEPEGYTEVAIAGEIDLVQDANYA